MTRYKYSDADFIEAIKNSYSVRDALLKLGVAPHGGSYKVFNLRVQKLNIDTSHFTGQGHLKGKSNIHVKKIPLSEWLVADSIRSLGTQVKKRIINEGLIKYECQKCSVKNIWQNEPLVLHLDHINGDHFDHRIKNLRLLCPNCHSQTDTYCGSNKEHNAPKIRKSLFVPQEPHKCETCGIKLNDSNSKNCKKCYDTNRKLLQKPYKRETKIIWPTIEELKLRLETTSYLSLAKELGVSDSAIRKYINRHS